MLMALLNELIDDLLKPLQDLPNKGVTDLDNKMFKLRDDDMVHVVTWSGR